MLDPRPRKKRRAPLPGPVARTPGDARIRVKIQRRGWILLFATTLFLGLGLLFRDSAPIHLALFGLLILVASFWWTRHNLKGLEFTRKLPQEVHAGRDFEVQVDVTNRRRWLDAAAIEMGDSILPFRDREARFPPIPPGEGRRLRLSTRLVMRGTHFHGPVFLRSTWPMGLWEAQATFDLPLRLIAFPKPVVPRELLGFREQHSPHGEARNRSRVEEEGNLSGVREFRPGDRLSGLHWPATARAGKPMVRERDRPTLEATSVLFHSCAPSGRVPGPESFEHSLELLAGVLQFCRSKGTPLDLTASFHGWETFDLPDPRHLENALRWLAEAEYQPETDVTSLVEAIRSRPGDHEIFVLSNVPLDDWEPLLPAFGRPLLCLDNTGLRLHAGRLPRAGRIPLPSSA